MSLRDIHSTLALEVEADLQNEASIPAILSTNFTQLAMVELWTSL